MILSFGAPKDLVGAWLKETGLSDTIHHVIWRGGDQLRTGCQITMDARRATSPRLGARVCETCRSDLLAKEKYGRKTTRTR